jgi:hypothetical protein
VNRAGLALGLLCIVSAGCGGAEPKPEGAPRAAVLGFLDDLQARRVQQACAVLDPSLARMLRVGALGAVRAPAGTPAERLRFIRRAGDAAKSCPGGLRLLAGQLGKQLPRVRAEASTAKVSKPFPVDAWVLGNEAWVVEARKGRWVITAANALGDVAG